MLWRDCWFLWWHIWVWWPQVNAVFDVCVVNTDAPSNRSRSPEAALHSCRFKSWIFSSFTYFSNMLCAVKLSLVAYWYTGSAFHQIPQSYLNSAEVEKRSTQQLVWLVVLVSLLCALVMGWAQVRLSFAVLRATMICVRGSRVKWRSLGVCDGVPISESL